MQDIVANHMPLFRKLAWERFPQPKNADMEERAAARQARDEFVQELALDALVKLKAGKFNASRSSFGNFVRRFLARGAADRVHAEHNHGITGVPAGVTLARMAGDTRDHQEMVVPYTGDSLGVRVSKEHVAGRLAHSDAAPDDLEEWAATLRFPERRLVQLIIEHDDPVKGLAAGAKECRLPMEKCQALLAAVAPRLWPEGLPCPGRRVRGRERCAA